MSRPGYGAWRRCLPKSVGPPLVFSLISYQFLPPSPAALGRQPLPRRWHSAGLQPRPPPGAWPRARASPPSAGPPSFPQPRAEGPSVRAHLRSRLARRRQRALCGCCRHVVVVVRRRRQRRRSSRTRRSSGPGAAPRRPWLGASWGGGGGRAVAGLAMSCRPVRSPPPPPGVRRSWRRGRLRPRRGGCHPLRRRRPAGAWGRRAWPGEGCPGRGRRRQGEARGVGAQRRGRGGVPARAAFPDLAGTGPWGLGL